MGKIPLRINDKEVKSCGFFAYDGYCKIYILENKEELEDAKKLGCFRIIPIEKIEETYWKANIFRAIHPYNSEYYYCKQTELPVFEYEDDLQESSENKYYIIVTEWLYPTESGRDIGCDYDTLNEALEECKKIVESEINTYSKTCNTDPTPINSFKKNGNINGYLITAKNGLDEWWFQAKVVEVSYGLRH
jgi:hypothetical protein